MSAEAVLAEKAKQRRRSGLLLEDEAVLQAMERGDAPEYLPLKFKDGQPAGESLASLERLGVLSQHIDKTLRALAKELRAGSIAADPWYRSQTENACALCDYAQACHRGEDDHIRYLSKLPADEVWARLEQEGGAEDGL